MAREFVNRPHSVEMSPSLDCVADQSPTGQGFMVAPLPAEKARVDVRNCLRAEGKELTPSACPHLRDDLHARCRSQGSSMHHMRLVLVCLFRVRMSHASERQYGLQQVAALSVLAHCLPLALMGLLVPTETLQVCSTDGTMAHAAALCQLHCSF